MPNEPQLPNLPNILSTIAGLGRDITQRIPDQNIFPLNPQAQKTFSPRDIAELFLPQSMLDVGLMAIPGGKAGKTVAKGVAGRARDALEEVGELVPAIMTKAGEVLPGVLGKHAVHYQVKDYYKKLAKYKDMSIDDLDWVQGFVDSKTGKWLEGREASKLSVERARAIRKGDSLETLKSTWRKADESKREAMVKARQEKVRQYEADILATKAAPKTEFSDDIVPAFRTQSGEVLPGKPEHKFHSKARDYYREKFKGEGRDVRDLDWEQGFVDASTGKWLEPREAIKLSQERAKQFLTKEKTKRASEADRLAAKAKVEKAKLKPFTGPTGEVFPPGIIDPNFPAPGGRTPVVAAKKDNSTGKVYSGIPYEELGHNEIEERIKDKTKGYLIDGFTNLRTGEWIEGTDDVIKWDAKKYYRVLP